MKENRLLILILIVILSCGPGISKDKNGNKIVYPLHIKNDSTFFLMNKKIVKYTNQRSKQLDLIFEAPVGNSLQFNLERFVIIQRKVL